MSKTKDHKNLKAIHNDKTIYKPVFTMSKTKDHKNLKAIHNDGRIRIMKPRDVKDQRS